MLPDTEDVIKYISQQYQKAKKIVEIGVGRLPITAAGLKLTLPKTQLIVVDVNQSALNEVKQHYPELITVLDDVLNPKLDVYRKSDLIYSIRPPIEIQPAIVDLAMRTGSDVIIRPLTGECLFTGRAARIFKLVNYEKAILYHARFRNRPK